MVDEVHELNKTTLVLIATLKNIIQRNRLKLKQFKQCKADGKEWKGGDIMIKKLIITSATLDEKILEDYFQDIEPAKISIKAPTFGVEAEYASINNDSLNLAENTVFHLKKILQ